LSKVAGGRLGAAAVQLAERCTVALLDPASLGYAAVPKLSLDTGSTGTVHRALPENPEGSRLVWTAYDAALARRTVDEIRTLVASCGIDTHDGGASKHDDGARSVRGTLS
jgi:hypothetical protein